MSKKARKTESSSDATSTAKKNYKDTLRQLQVARTHNSTAPWTLVHANDKQLARLNVIKDLIRLRYLEPRKWPACKVIAAGTGHFWHDDDQEVL